MLTSHVTCNLPALNEFKSWKIIHFALTYIEELQINCNALWKIFCKIVIGAAKDLFLTRKGGQCTKCVSPLLYYSFIVVMQIAELIYFVFDHLDSLCGT